MLQISIDIFFIKENGCVTFNVENEMEVILTLDGTPSLPWKLVDIKILVKSISSDYGMIIVAFYH